MDVPREQPVPDLGGARPELIDDVRRARVRRNPGIGDQEDTSLASAIGGVPLRRPAAPCLTKHHEVPGVGGDEHAPEPRRARALVDVGRASATNPRRGDDIVAQHPKRFGAPVGNVLVEHQIVRRPPRFGPEGVAIQEEEGVDGPGVGLGGGDRGADGRQRKVVVAGGSGDVPPIAQEVGDQRPNRATVMDETGAVAASPVRVERDGQMGRSGEWAAWLSVLAMGRASSPGTRRRRRYGRHPSPVTRGEAALRASDDTGHPPHLIPSTPDS